MQDPRDRVHDEHVVGEDMLDFLHAFMEGIFCSICTPVLLHHKVMQHYIHCPQFCISSCKASRYACSVQ